MKSGLLLLGVALLLGGLVGTLVVRDPGYVLISYADMALETSLWFALVVLFAGYCLIRLLSFLFFRAARSGGRMGNWLRGRKDRSARQNTLQGLLLMAQGDWAQARKLLTGSATRADSPLINYLAAARAAHELGDMESRDQLLRQASESTSDSRFAVGLTQAELQKSASQWEQCLATLLRLREEAPRHQQVLRMLVDCYRALGDWQAMLEVLPDAKKQKALSEADCQQLLLEGWTHRFGNTASTPQQIWNDVPKELKRDAAVVSAYSAAEIARGDSTRALPVLRAALQHNWDPELVRLYGELQGENPQEQLVVAESWLKERPNDADLLLALGRISMMNQQWPKAREYLEASLRLNRSVDVYAELGRLCSAMGDTDRGNEYLLHSLPSLPDLPLPAGS
jgi:HemY protein